ncbi:MULTISPECIES: hypothetical protein [unclassified Legionella]|uniref:hypothetical protein n=1 Tax=unclassified Legionella TaxID=2622702 RepID=UPI001055630F|nr:MULTISPECIES: hypothetical protein [unclassified Legionella]MDI9817869.1 hypothetical protein [Legionella sp. PL877]
MIRNQLIKNVAPAEILRCLLDDYIKHISYFTESILPFFVSKNTTNIKFARKFTKLLSCPGDFDHVFSIIGCLNTHHIFIDDEFITILGAFFSLFEKYSFHLSAELRAILGVEDIFLSFVNQYIDYFAKQEQWASLAELDFIPEKRFIGAEKLLSQNNEQTVKIMNKLDHHSTDPDFSHLRERLSRIHQSDIKLVQKIKQLSNQLKIPLEQNYSDESMTQGNIFWRIKLFLDGHRASDRREENQQFLCQLKPFIGNEIKPQIIDELIQILQKNKDCFLSTSSQIQCFSGFDMLIILGDIFTKDNLPEARCEELIATLILFLRNNERAYYLEETVIKALRALAAIIPATQHDLVVKKLATHLSRFNDLVFSTCISFKNVLSDQEIIMLASQWSSSSHFEVIKTAQNALAFISILPPKMLQPIVNELVIKLCQPSGWEYQKQVYQLLYQYRSIISPDQWSYILNVFKKNALDVAPWDYPGLLQRIYEVKEYLPSAEIGGKLLADLQWQINTTPTSLDQVKMLIKIGRPEAIAMLLEVLFAKKKHDSGGLNALWLLKEHVPVKKRELFWGLLLPIQHEKIDYSMSLLLNIIDGLDEEENILWRERALERLNWLVVQSNSQEVIWSKENILKFDIYINEENKKLIAQNILKKLWQVDKMDLEWEHHLPIIKSMEHYFNYLPVEQYDALFQFLFSFLSAFSKKFKVEPVVSFILKFHKALEKEQLREMGEKWLTMLDDSSRGEALFFLGHFQPLIPQELYKDIIKKLLLPIINDADCIDEEYYALRPYIRYISFEQKIALLSKFSFVETSCSARDIKMKLFLDIYAGYRNDMLHHYLQRFFTEDKHILSKAIITEIVYGPN